MKKKKDETTLDNSSNVIEEFSSKLSKTTEYRITAPDNQNIFSLPIQLVYLTLPYKSIKDLAWNKTIEEYTLSISSGINQNKEPYGIPYGVIARKLIYLTCTEALKKEKQTINLGSSYTEAFKRLGISEKRAGGQTINRFKEQVLRLFFSRMMLFKDKSHGNTEHTVNQALNLARGLEFFNNDDKFNFKITLTDDFYNYIQNSKVIPFDYDIVRKLDKNPMLMDIYIFLNYKGFSANYSGKNIFISFDELHRAFGTLSPMKSFKQNLQKNLEKLKVLHSGLIFLENELDGEDGIWISKHSKSNVSNKEDKKEQLDIFDLLDENEKDKERE